MIEFPATASPDVSIILVTYGAWDWVLRTLTRLRDVTPDVFEIVLVVNPLSASDIDPSDEVRGATVIRNASNIGFGPAANLGAQQASARALCFMNPDVLAEPGWLEPLLARLEDPAVAAAVPLILGLDGAVQDAGPLLGRDGRTVALGAGADPDDPAYRFARAVDYGTGACLALRRDAFEAVDGFAEDYLPAYCEDVDLCLRLGQKGWLTVYEPASRIRHAGGVSVSASDLEAMVARSTRTLRARWSWKLNRRADLVDWVHRPHRVIAARDADAFPRILMATGGPPDPAGEASRVARHIRSAWSRARVTLVAANAEPDADPIDLSAAGIESVTAPSEDWFAERLFHYQAAIVDDDADGRIGALIRWSQPQSAWLRLDDLASSTDETLPAALASAGIAPVSRESR